MVGGEVLQAHACAVLLQSHGKADRCSGCVLHMDVARPMLRRMHGLLTAGSQIFSTDGCYGCGKQGPSATLAECWKG